MHDTLIDNHLSLLAEQTKETTNWSEPLEYYLGDDADVEKAKKLLESGSVQSVIDNLVHIAKDMHDLYYPSEQANQERRDEYIGRILEQGAAFGRWFYFSWSKEFIHYPDKDNHRALRTSRNRMLITAEEQSRLYDSTIAVFGLSVGSNVVERLVASGIGGRLIIGDMDIIEPSNLNRINSPFMDVGLSKVDATAKKISEIDPYIEQIHLSNGVDAQNIHEVIATYRPDILIDEIDDLSVKAILRQVAMQNGIPLIMATDVGDKSIVDIERYDLGGAKPFNGTMNQEDFRAMIKGEISARKRGQMLLKIIGLRNLSPRLIDSAMRIDRELSGLPQLGTTAAMGGALTTVATREILLGRKMASGRYICSPKSILNLDSQETSITAARTLISFIKSRDHSK